MVLIVDIVRRKAIWPQHPSALGQEYGNFIFWYVLKNRIRPDEVDRIFLICARLFTPDVRYCPPHANKRASKFARDSGTGALIPSACIIPASLR